MNKSRKILISHSGGIGDLLLSLPAMRLFCQNFSPYSLELLGYPERLALISWDLQAQKIHSFEKAEMAYLYSGQASLPNILKSFLSSFEIALLFGKKQSQNLQSILKEAGVKQVLFLDSFPNCDKLVHVTDYHLAALEKMGLRRKDEWITAPLHLAQEATKFGAHFWREHNITPDQKILAIHPGSGNPAKNWSPKNFARVADYFAPVAKILLISGPASGSASEGITEVKKELKIAKPILAHDLPLIHLAGLLNWCTAYLGNDSGITHLAASLGIPTLAIFGPTNPLVWGPKGERVQILYTDISCSPCWPNFIKNCPRHCLEAIHAELVVEKLATWGKFAK